MKKLPLLAFVLFCAGCVTAPATWNRSTIPATLREAYAGHFLIGTALAGRLPGSYTPDELALARAQFNVITPENCMKPQHIHPLAETWKWEEADAFVHFAQANGMKAVGHTLVWHAQTPAWFFVRADGRPVTRDIAIWRLQQHIATEVGRYKGRILGWDVVNEVIADKPTDATGLRDTPWRKAIGDDYIALAFGFAHAADPAAELYLNDYGIESGEKHEAAVRWVKKLKAMGVPITGVGIQGHWVLDHVPFKQLEKAINDFDALGVKVMISELDIDVLPRESGADVNILRPQNLNPATQPAVDIPAALGRQAEQYGRLFQILATHRNAISRVTFWGLNDGHSWLNQWPTHRTNYGLLFDRQNQPKSAFWAAMDVLLLPGM